MVGLLAAVGTAMSAIVGLTHGILVWLILAAAALATGLAACLAIQKNALQKKATCSECSKAQQRSLKLQVNLTCQPLLDVV
jgi:uncharacterized protein HemX